ncbi:MAG: alpha/beta fold hydrolase [Chloroflexi bacterium]|nr:alpha/beta fold hydrolase [Chloroflexota bacterium]
MRLAYATFHPFEPAAGAAERPLPALIALHGFGSHALDLLTLAPELAGGRLLVICPQAPYHLPDFYGFSWSRDPTAPADPAEPDAAADALRTLLDDAIPRLGIDPTRLALLGFSQGGMMAAPLALGEPQRFAGLALLSTSVVGARSAVLTAAPDAARLPVLVQHGTQDPAIPVAQAQASVERLRELGLAPEYEEYAMAHEVSRESTTALTRWLERVLRLDAR